MKYHNFEIWVILSEINGDREGCTTQDILLISALGAMWVTVGTGGTHRTRYGSTLHIKSSQSSLTCGSGGGNARNGVV